jgi:hypothetical protein
MFLAGRGLQSAELNEIQDYANSRISGIGDAIFADGDVISGAGCIVDTETGAVIIEAGKIYLRGAVREVLATNLAIPTDRSVVIGIWYDEKTVTELEDATLRDPAVGTRNYQEPGAARLKSELVWDFKATGIASVDKGEPKVGEPQWSQFYPVYSVENGVLIQNAPPPQLDAVQTAIARYDKESNGSYVVSGLNVTYLKTENNEQTFVVAEGKAHVDGYEIELPHSLRVKLQKNPDIQAIESDPYTFQPEQDGSMLLVLNRAPIAEITKVDATIEKTITMTHGSYTGCSDAIPDTAVLEIVQVNQGGTLYTNIVDYKLRTGEVDWSPGGSEPSPGSTYTLKYRVRGRLTPTEITETYMEVPLGSVEVAGVSDLIALANVERVSSGTDVEFVLTEATSGANHRLSEDFPTALQERVTDTLTAKAILRGTNTMSPALYPGVQIVMGNVAEEADYVTRTIPAGSNTKVSVTYEAYLTGLADVRVYVAAPPAVANPGGSWTLVALASSQNIGNSWVERTHSVDNFNGENVRVKLVLSGNILYRPRVKSLRVITV